MTESVITVRHDPSEWTPDHPFTVSHTEFGLYDSFATRNDAFVYAVAVARMMDLEVEIVY